MPTTPDPAGRLLVGYDGSASSELAMHWAFEEAERRDADLTVLQSWHEPIFSERTWMERWNDPAGEEREATEVLRAAVIQAQSGHAGVTWTPLLVPERPGPALIAESEGHQLVVLGSRGRGGFGGLALGSVAEHVAAASVAPVAIIRGDARAAGPITVGLDGSASSRRALRWAVREAQVRSTPVRAVLVWSDLVSIGLHGAEPLRATSTAADARITLNQVLSEELGPDHGGVHADAVCGGPARSLLDASEGSAILVLGAPAHGDGARHLGGTAHQVLRHASCPVVIAR